MQLTVLYLCIKVGRSLRRIRWIRGQSPWPPAWPGFLRKPSTCKSESIWRWTNSFMIISLVFYRSTPQLPNCATKPTNGKMALDQRQSIPVAFLDLSKAYNRVPTAGLLFKLSGCGFSPHSLKWMNSFFANRRQRVKVGNMHSQWATISCGIPQGTVLGPTLFLVFINDLPTNLVGKPSIFADDFTVFSRETTSLRHARL